MLGALSLLSAGCSSESSADPPSTPRTFETCFDDLENEEQPFIEVQSFESEDGAWQIRRARRPGDRPSVGETFPYDLIHFAVKSPEDSSCVTDRGALQYEFAHHNWDETWEARTSLARYVGRETLALGAELAWTDTLTIYPLEGDTPSAGPLELVDTGCFTLPYDLNACMARTRTDTPPEDFQ